MLHNIIYISKVTKLLKDPDLIALLEQSREWNLSHGLTGMLLYIEGKVLSKTEGRFMQVLEGSPEEVIDIFEKIKKDTRHHYIIPLKMGAIEERSFNDWTMGFHPLDMQEMEKLPGFFTLDESFLRSADLQRSNIPLNFLKSFYQTHKAYTFSK